MNIKLLLPAILVLITPFAIAQGGPPSGGPGMMSMHHHEGGPGGGDMHGGPGFEGGMWWKNPELITKLAITPDQEKKFEDICIHSRVELIDLHASLEKEQLLLGPLMDANPVDQPKAIAQIDKVAETRAALEKTNAKMLLSIRSVLTPDQWTKLQAMHHEHRGMEMHRGGPGGMDSHHGPMGGPGMMHHDQQTPPPTPPPAE
jgi:Spy/CpxP family protein refolding chaperone